MHARGSCAGAPRLPRQIHLRRGTAGRVRCAHAKAELLRLTGVGIKVAECICLFALHHIDAFPVDTHIRQMLDAHYPKGFPLKRYKGFAGVMQQYAFYYELSLKG